MNCEEIALSSTVMFVSEKSCLVTRESGDIHLTPNERRLLELIISGKCKKETIFDEIWHNQGTVVSESSYHQLIKMLRRKLQQAGLPGSMIKTIPRYGVVLAPEECACTEENEAPCCESTTASEENVASAEAFSEPEKQVRNLRARWLWLCLLPIVVPPLLVSLRMERPIAFQEQVVEGGVTFHFSSRRNLDAETLARKRLALPSEVNNVYIATNGPKVMVAECEGELSKEGRCTYEYYSSY